MSALIFAYDAEHAYVATDTLVADASGELNPVTFMSKVFALPHLRALMVCTGWMEFGQQWFLMLNGHFVAPSCEVLNQYAPGSLRELWKGFQEYGHTSTIYHFIADSERVRVFAFRSTKDFEVEQLPAEGIAFKPPFVGHESHELRTLDDIVSAMDKQRVEQAAIPAVERVAIGGEVVFAELHSDGKTMLWVGHRFGDYDAQLAQMIDNLPANQNS